MTNDEILEDIRLRLKGISQSKLHGDKGLVQATMDAWHEAAEDADKGWKEVTRLKTVLRDCAELATQSMNSDVAHVALLYIEKAARTAIDV